MSAIPADVMEAANRACDGYEALGMPGKGRDELIVLIAQAIMAERERCVRVALRYNYSAGDAHTMAAAIRSGAQS